MISSQEKEVFWVLDLVREQEADRLEALLAAVDVVAQKKVVGLGRKSSIFEQPQEIGVLTMNVSANLQRSLQLEQDRLLQENLSRLKAQASDLVFRHLDSFAWSAPPH